MLCNPTVLMFQIAPVFALVIIYFVMKAVKGNSRHFFKLVSNNLPFKGSYLCRNSRRFFKLVSINLLKVHVCRSRHGTKGLVGDFPHYHP